MKIKVLATLLFCLISQFAFSQFKMDVSAGFFEVPTQLSGINRTGFFVSSAPSFRLNNKFQITTSLQYRNEVSNDEFDDKGSLDFIPQLEYALFDFLTLGAGGYYSYSLNGVAPADRIGPSSIGLVGALKFKIKNVFGFARYSHGLFLSPNQSIVDLIGEDTLPIGYYQLGVGYTLEKK